MTGWKQLFAEVCVSGRAPPLGLACLVPIYIKAVVNLALVGAEASVDVV